MLNILHYFHVIYVQAHLPNEPNKLWRTDSIVIPKVVFLLLIILLFMFRVCHAVVWSPAVKGLTSWFSCM